MNRLHRPGLDTSAGVAPASGDGLFAFRRLLRQYGRNTVSPQLLGPGWQHHLSSGAESGVAFRECGGFTLAAGDPLCEPEALSAVVESFCRRSKGKNRRLAFVSAGETVAEAGRALGLSAVKVGEEGLFDLDKHTFAGGRMKALRHHESRARRRGVTVRAISPGDPDWPAVAPVLDGLFDPFSRKRPGVEMGFLMEMQRPSDASERDATFLCAVIEGRPVAYLRTVPIYASGGVYLEDYVYDEDVPDGTVEVLFHEACDVMRSRGAAYVTWGTSPLAGLDQESCSDAPMVGRFLRAAFRHVSWPYNFRSLHAFKSRFHPTRHVSKYLVFDGAFDARLCLALALAYAPRADPGRFVRRLLSGPKTEPSPAVAGHPC